ncbi:MAG: ribonuclease HII [Bacilli bacterium]|nr:ribonuclease HII [Bacilli bacterium]
MALDYEKQFYDKGYEFIAGTDEAGRGCLLGPVFAAAVILPKGFSSELINDSKKLTEKQREKAFEIIIENAIAYGIASIEPEEIDKINILEASRKAMGLALDQIKHKIDLILTDCMKLPNRSCEVIDLVHGDALSQNIAAASILAKVSRDHACYELDKKYPQYHIAKNKGYGTKDHLEALEEFGPVEGLHRFSYAPVKKSRIKKISLFL